jgi:hypothetical protein
MEMNAACWEEESVERSWKLSLNSRAFGVETYLEKLAQSRFARRPRRSSDISAKPTVACRDACLHHKNERMMEAANRVA